MFDMLGITSDNKLSLNNVRSLKIGRAYDLSVIPDKNYKYAFKIETKDNCLFWLKTQPRFSNIKETAMYINPTRLEGYEDLKQITLQTLGENLNINRVDLCSDLPIPIQEINSRIRIKYKQKRSDFEYGDQLTGFYYGTRNEVIAIYDKARQLDKFHDYKIKKNIEHKQSGELTRVEIRLKGNKIPYSHLDQLESYVNHNPFSMVQIVDFPNHQSEKEFKKRKAENLKSLAEVYGFNAAYKILSRSGNFTKTYRQYISSSRLNQILLEQYQESIRDFLKK